MTRPDPATSPSLPSTRTLQRHCRSARPGEHCSRRGEQAERETTSHVEATGDPQEARAFDDAVKLRKKGIDDAAGKATGKGRNGDLEKARDGSQAAGELAGKAYLRKTFPDHQVVKSPLAPTKSGGQGAGSFDMLRKGGKDGDEWVIAECKGGDGGIGKRISAHDEYQLAQQGTREYVESMIATWRERTANPASTLSPKQKFELSRQADSLERALQGRRLRYLLIRQRFAPDGRPLAAEAMEFAL